MNRPLAIVAAALVLLASRTLAAPAPPAQPGTGTLAVDSSPAADRVVVTRTAPPPEPDQLPDVAGATPARFVLPPGTYRVELDRDGGRYAYDLSVDVAAQRRRELEVQLRSSRPARVEPLVFAGVGAAATAGLLVACAANGGQYCLGAAGAGALTALAGYFGWYALRHDGAVVKNDLAPAAAAIAPPAPPAPASKAPAASKPDKKK